MKQEENDKNTRLGDPLDRDEDSSAHSGKESLSQRSGDNGLGQPDPVVKDARVISDQEKQEYREQTDAQLRLQFEQKLQDMQQFTKSWELPGGIKRFLAWILFFIGAISGVFIVNQGVSFLSNINSLAQPYKTIAIFAMVFFSIVLFAIIVSLFWAGFKMKRLKPFDIKPLRVLQQREDMRRFAQEKQEEARDIFKEYLKSYSLNRKNAKLLIRAGLNTNEIESLAAVRDKLLDKNKPLSSNQWLDMFGDSWQSVLDRAADRRIKDYSIKAGFGTAASPVAFVDQMVVMYSCFAMLKDIMKIYNLRPAFGQTVVVLSRSIINIYLSGMIENATEGSANSVADYIREHCGKIAGGAGRIAGAKVAEAAINGLLLYNLGKRAKKMLQPMIR